MATRIGINGFGRIGRQVFKALRDRYGDAIEVVAVNDLTDNDTLAHLLKYDSNYGHFNGNVSVEGSDLMVDGKRLKSYAEANPSNLPWGDLGVDLVVESTGIFTDRDKASAHFKAGAPRVIITAPAKNPDFSILLGVNEEKYDPAQHKLISNASCTTNCLAPVAKVLNDRFGIRRGLMTTIHSYTNDQRILDLPHKDLRRARAAAVSIIPTSTGAAQAVAEVIPELKGKFTGYALRVPTSTVSIVDFSVELEKDATQDEINAAFDEYASGRMEGVLGVSREPLVSVDYKGDPRSSIVDAELTLAFGNLAKIVSWYDNEWGYSCRIADLCAYIAARDGASIKIVPQGVARTLQGQTA